MIKKPANYIGPTKNQIDNFNKSQGVLVNNYDLFNDMSNFFFHQITGNKDYFDVDKLDEADPNMVKFYSEVFDKKIVGACPMEKAFNLMASLLKNKEMNENGEIAISDFKMLSEILPIKQDVEENKDIEEIMKKFKISTRISKHYQNIINKISIIDSIKGSFAIKSTKRHRKEENSRDTKFLKLENYSDVYRTSPVNFAMPHFDVMFAKKDLTINQPVSYHTGKQQIVILLDKSGSMDDEVKKNWVKAIMTDRLSYVYKEQCEIFFGYYESDIYKDSMMHLHNKASVEKFFKKYTDSPSGGGTDIAQTIRTVQELKTKDNFFNSGRNMSRENLEILVINDGQDRVDPNKVDYKTNIISLDRSNSAMKAVCDKTGGKYICLN